MSRLLFERELDTLGTILDRLERAPVWIINKMQLTISQLSWNLICFFSDLFNNERFGPFQLLIKAAWAWPTFLVGWWDDKERLRLVERAATKAQLELLTCEREPSTSLYNHRHPWLVNTSNDVDRQATKTTTTTMPNYTTAYLPFNYLLSVME